MKEIEEKTYDILVSFTKLSLKDKLLAVGIINSLAKKMNDVNTKEIMHYNVKNED